MYNLSNFSHKIFIFAARRLPCRRGLEPLLFRGVRAPRPLLADMALAFSDKNPTDKILLKKLSNDKSI